MTEPEKFWLCSRVEELAVPRAPGVKRACTDCGALCWVSRRQLQQGLPGPIICYPCGARYSGRDIPTAVEQARREGVMKRDELGREYFILKGVMRGWPHRALFAAAFGFWVLSVTIGIEWLALAAVVWLPGQFRWEAFLKAQRKEPIPGGTGGVRAEPLGHLARTQIRRGADPEMAVMTDLGQALMVAIRVHANQQDKQGEPYLLHVLRVTEAVGEDAKHVAVLHDVLEDGEGWEDYCSSILDDDEFQALELLTRGPNESYAKYITTMAARPERAFRLAREVKLADLRDNLGRIPEEPLSGPGGPAYDEWVREWSGLCRRYEKAIVVLETC